MAIETEKKSHPSWVQLVNFIPAIFRPLSHEGQIVQKVVNLKTITFGNF